MNLTMKQQLRVDVISRYLQHEIHTRDACIILNIKERQFRRIVKAFREEGLVSVVHGNVGRSPKNKTGEMAETLIIRKYRLQYFGLNVVHFLEKLREDYPEQRLPSYSATRAILLREKLIEPKVKRRRGVHKMRKRYEKEGLMIQIDGSHHHWIMGHTPCCLTAAIDDATGKIMGGTFTPTETTFAAMEVVKSIVETHGAFHMLYSDRAGIYGNNKRASYSNMERAMRELGIASLQATTPQGKGRVERLFQTLQDRLCAEMRLKGISSLEEANTYLEEFIPKFNHKFAVAPSSSETAYRPLPSGVKLSEVFCLKDLRTIQNGHVISLEGEYLRVEVEDYSVKKRVEIRQYPNGSTKFFIEGQEIQVTKMEKHLKAAS